MSDPVARCLSVLCQDLLFSTLAKEEADGDAWRDLAKRRLDAHRHAWNGDPMPSPQTLDDWAISLSRAHAPLSVPKFLPMHELSDAITLAGGSRGLKSLFSSKPSDKDVDRVRRLGGIAARMAASGMGANGTLTPDEHRLVRAFAATLGLGPDDEAPIAATQGGSAETIDLAGEIEPKMAKLLVRGAWGAALQDGLDVPDEGVIAVMANRIGMPMEESGALGTKVKEEGHERHVLAKSILELVAFVLRDELPRAAPYARAIADLLVPAPFRDATLTWFHGGTPPALPQTKPGGKSARQAMAAVAWAVAIESNPTMTRKAILAARLDAGAGALGAAEDAMKLRHEVELFVDAHVAALAGTG